MAQTRQNTSSLPLPPEVLILIIKRIRKPDLKQVRLVCRSLRLLAAPLLFDQIAFSPSFHTLNIANHTAQNFGGHVKTLFYFPVKYGELSLEKFSYFSQQLCDHDTIETCIRQDDEDGHTGKESFQQHIEHSFHSYSSRAQEQLEMDETGAHLAHLCSILGKLPKAQKLVIGSTGAYGHLRRQDMRHLGIGLSDLCPRKDCILSLEDHINMQVVPHCYSDPDMRDFLHPAMLALHATNSAITKLDVQIHKAWDSNAALLPVSAFDRSIPQFRYTVLRLSTMTKLRFDLGIDDQGSADGEVFYQRDVARALANARNLECLYISLAPDFEHLLRDLNPVNTFDGILGGCKFPKLQSLVLNGFNVDPTELSGFLKSSAKLETLYMHKIILLSG